MQAIEKLRQVGRDNATTDIARRTIITPQENERTPTTKSKPSTVRSGVPGLAQQPRDLISEAASLSSETS